MSIARQTDKHTLYEMAVQEPNLLIGLIEQVYEQLAGRTPQSLREDFCGTANLSALWILQDEQRKAVGVDNDPKVLRWAEKYNRRPLGDRAKRLKLTESDVLACRSKADVVASLNFSHFIFTTREQMLKYLRHARRCVKPGGVFVLDVYGGPGAMKPCLDRRDHGQFEYLWEQKSYDPLTAQVTNYIHFAFPDGSQKKRAFTYRWRLWTLVELRELLTEAGFDDLAVTFEAEDGFDENVNTADLEAWVAYLIAHRQ